MVKVHFQLISHELGGLPVMVRCCNLELMLKSSLNHIKRVTQKPIGITAVWEQLKKKEEEKPMLPPYSLNGKSTTP